jgi:hypothetical protein
MDARLVGRDLELRGRIVLEGLDSSLNGEPDPDGVGIFLTARAVEPSSRLCLSAGRVRDLERYTACHRYEPYWMKPVAGALQQDVPEETQFLLAQLAGGQWLTLVPLIDDECRSSLRGHRDGRLELLIETGDPHLGTVGGLVLFAATGPDPFELLTRSARVVAERLGCGPLRVDKPVPVCGGQCVKGQRPTQITYPNPLVCWELAVTMSASVALSRGLTTRVRPIPL